MPGPICGNAEDLIAASEEGRPDRERLRAFRDLMIERPQGGCARAIVDLMALS